MCTISPVLKWLTHLTDINIAVAQIQPTPYSFDTFMRPTYGVEWWHLGGLLLFPRSGPQASHSNAVCQPRINQITRWTISDSHPFWPGQKKASSAASLPEVAHFRMLSWFMRTSLGYLKIAGFVWPTVKNPNIFGLWSYMTKKNSKSSERGWKLWMSLFLENWLTW